jgi:hypothetical protein
VNRFSVLKRPIWVLFLLLLLSVIVFSVLAYRVVVLDTPVDLQTAAASGKPTPSPAATPTALARQTLLPVQSPDEVLGVEGSVGISYTGISWVRLAYPSCGWGDLSGNRLKNAIELYHEAGTRVLLTVCQGPNNASFLNAASLQDAARGNADAVQCGNEEMKQDPSVAFLYTSPDQFAHFYDLCQQAVHKVRASTPVLLGSLDPHVGGVDYQPLVDQMNYLDQVQTSMNTSVHPNGNWSWRTQTLGLIDSWHNGYPNSSVNSLAGLFSFWARAFNVDVNSGELGKHLWVVEGTGCFKGCGLDENNAAQVASAHVLTLITDVQTAMADKVPFFYFSGEDFHDQGVNWPVGILDSKGHPKPLLQNLAMGSRSLDLSCPTGHVTVVNQLQLLAQMYHRCTLPSNYYATLSS